MKLLHTSDWHLGRSLYDFSLIEDQQRMLEELLALIERERVDAVVIAGDIYDRPVPSAQAIQLYDHFLSQAVMRMGIPVLAVAGNHDSGSRLEFGSSLYASSGYHICGQTRREVHRVTLQDAHGPVYFWLIPYLHPADVRSLFPDSPVRTFDDAYRVLLEHGVCSLDPGSRNIAVAHGFFSPIGGREDKALLTSDSEVNTGGMDIVDSGYFSAFDYVALGHLHAPQRAGGDAIRYSGSPLKYSLSEQKQHKSYTLVDLGPKGAVATQSVPVHPMRDLRTVEGSLEELLDPAGHTNRQFDDYVFAYLTDDSVLYPMEKLRKLFPHLLGLRLVENADGPAAEIKLGERMPRLTPEKMFQLFYREMKGFEMPPETAAFLHETLQQREEDAQ